MSRNISWSNSSVSDNIVELDERLKTPALVVGADHLEAYNMNWTFESIRATFCVGRSKYPSCPHPLGWYYEVTLKSNGILQIGMFCKKFQITAVKNNYANIFKNPIDALAYFFS
jgi:hypothetical protein